MMPISTHMEMLSSYICLPIDDAIALNQYNDASNGYYVHSRYCNVNGKWTRMCISKKNGYTNRY
jgi:hypothetical protein